MGGGGGKAGGGWKKVIDAGIINAKELSKTGS